MTKNKESVNNFRNLFFTSLTPLRTVTPLSGLCGGNGVSDEVEKNSINTYFERNKQLGSSETTRVISYFTDQFNFAHYLAGLMDADGCISISKKNYISIEITLHDEDVKTLYKVREILGFGVVRKRVGVKAYRIRWSKRLGVQKIINLINGKLLTPQKRIQLSRALQILNIIPITGNSFTNQNAWLAGFFDGEGYFSIRNQYTLTLSVSQKEKEILLFIKEKFGCGNIDYDKSWDGYNYCITDLNHLKKFLQYFSTYPLLTVKNADFVTFRRLVLFKERKYHWKWNIHKAKIDRLISVFRKRKKI